MTTRAMIAPAHAIPLNMAKVFLGNESEYIGIITSAAENIEARSTNLMLHALRRICFQFGFSFKTDYTG